MKGIESFSFDDEDLSKLSLYPIPRKVKVYIQELWHTHGQSLHLDAKMLEGKKIKRFFLEIANWLIVIALFYKYKTLQESDTVQTYMVIFAWIFIFFSISAALGIWQTAQTRALTKNEIWQTMLLDMHGDEFHSLDEYIHTKLFQPTTLREWNEVTRRLTWKKLVAYLRDIAGMLLLYVLGYHLAVVGYFLGVCCVHYAQTHLKKAIDFEIKSLTKG